MDIFDSISPLDFRYYGRDKAMFDKLQPYLSENAMIGYMLKVEVALTRTLADKRICSKKIADEVEKAAKNVVAELKSMPKKYPVWFVETAGIVKGSSAGKFFS